MTDVKIYHHKRFIRTSNLRKYLPWAGIAILIIGIGVTIFLLRNRQDTRSRAAFTPTYEKGLWTPNGSSHTIAEGSDGTIYVGGSFDYVGPLTGPAAPVSTITGKVLGPITQFRALNQTQNLHGIVTTAIPDGNNGWYVGGYFTNVGEFEQTNLVHIQSDGTVNPNFDPSPTMPTQLPPGTVYALALDGTTLYVGGVFDTIGGQPRNNLAAIDTITGNVTSWNPNPNNYVYAMVIGDGKLYVGGNFSSMDGQTRNGGTAFSLSTGVMDPNWNPNAVSSAPVPNNCGVATIHTFTLSPDSSTLYAAGCFSEIGGQPIPALAKLSLVDGSTDPNWEPITEDSNPVTDMEATDDGVYVSGTFSTLDTTGGAQRNYLVFLDETTGQASAWNPNPDGIVDALSIENGILYTGGEYTVIAGENRRYAAAFDVATEIITAWNPNPDGFVDNINVEGCVAYMGGAQASSGFSSIGGVDRNNLAAINPTTGEATPWDPNADGDVYSLAVLGDKVYVSGNFANVGGQARGLLAAIDTTTGNADPTWIPNPDDEVNVVSASTSKIYVGGFFTNVGGQTRTGLAELDPSTGNATSWNPNPDSDVDFIFPTDSRIYVSGWFDNIGGQTRNGTAALDPITGNADATWNPNPNERVRTILATDSEVFVGGAFTSIGGQTRNRIAKLNTTDGAADATWNPDAGVPAFSFNTIKALALSLDGTKLYVGGNFNTIGGQTRNQIAEIDAATGVLGTWNPDLTYSDPFTFIIDDSYLYVGSSAGSPLWMPPLLRFNVDTQSPSYSNFSCVAATATPTNTNTPTITPTLPPGVTATNTPTPTITLTPTISATPSATLTPTRTPTPTLPPGVTATNTPIPTLPPGVTATPTTPLIGGGSSPTPMTPLIAIATPTTFFPGVQITGSVPSVTLIPGAEFTTTLIPLGGLILMIIGAAFFFL